MLNNQYPHLNAINDVLSARAVICGESPSFKKSLGQWRAEMKANPDKLEKGLKALIRVSGFSFEKILDNLSLTTESDLFCNVKGLSKLLGIVMFFAGDASRLDPFCRSLIGCIIGNATHGKVGILENAVNGSEFTLQELQKWTCFKAGENLDEIQELIRTRGYRNYALSSVATNASQMKTVIRSVGLATGVKWAKESKSLIQLDNKATREFIFHKNSVIVVNIETGRVYY